MATSPKKHRYVVSLVLLMWIVPVINQGSTGHRFTGKKFRNRRSLETNYLTTISTTPSLDECLPSYSSSNSRRERSKLWGVVTTIFKPSDAIMSLLSRGICVVVVADKNTPTHTYVSLAKHHCLVFLSVEIQACLAQLPSPVGQFVKTLPWNHFGRKNLGYVVAVMQSAERIWDFDDDNLLTGFDWVMPTVHTQLVQTALQNGTESSPNGGFKVINPYPYFGTPFRYAWPRGFPLSEIKNPLSGADGLSELFTFRYPENSIKIGVIQVLADHDPDVDAIFRLTVGVPFSFHHKHRKMLVIPSLYFTPFNAQATLWFEKAFWALLLPITVPGRVSDIWRAYITETLFAGCHLHVAFHTPVVRQVRNAHDYMSDFEAEQDLFLKTEALLKFLSSFKSSGKLEDMLELYAQLYERGFLDWNDVLLVRAWVKLFPKQRLCQHYKRALASVGILSSHHHAQSRKVIRSTYLPELRNMHSWFILDHDEENLTSSEVLEFGQYVQIPSLPRGRARRFGQKLFLWYQFVHAFLPSSLVMKMDDDVLVCPNRFQEDLEKRQNISMLYAGYLHHKPRRIDEGILLVGAKLVDLVLTQKNLLNDTNYGGTSLGEWIGNSDPPIEAVVESWINASYFDWKVKDINSASVHNVCCRTPILHTPGKRGLLKHSSRIELLWLKIQCSSI